MGRPSAAGDLPARQGREGQGLPEGDADAEVDRRERAPARQHAMRRLLVLLLVLALPAPAALAAATTLPDVEDEVMCVTCGTALNISQAPSADREREFIKRRIAEGLDKKQIKQRLVAEYGP